MADWILYSIYWYSYLLLIGLIFFPLTKFLFPKFYDYGYIAAKTIGIIAITYIAFILGTVQIVPYGQWTLYGILIGAAAFNYYLFKKFHGKQFIEKSKLPVFLFQELLFFIALLFLAFIRGQEPSVRGLEKFMDFGFMNSILKSTYFPPLDMWYSGDLVNPQGYPINYYYFGHMSGAMLIRLSGIPAAVGYNLILATIFAQGITLVYSLVSNIVHYIQTVVLNRTVRSVELVVYGLIGSFIVNLGGNLHTIYLFTKGYPNESPVPFWQILSAYNPTRYWYPNATRFIPFTIHEFPSYSYVVADLHGHVFDIPFVLLTLMLLISFFMASSYFSQRTIRVSPVFNWIKELIAVDRLPLMMSALLGFLIAVHYMTNVLDGPIYLLLMMILLALAFGLTWRFAAHLGTIILTFAVTSYPFSAFFKPFVSGVGVNCSPTFLVNLEKIGPFLFEKDHCQVSELWMLFVLWGFFWIAFGIFLYTLFREKYHAFYQYLEKKAAAGLIHLHRLDICMIVLFAYGTFLIIIPEFFYIKDIYPAHFRANTMFKLGYQAFIMMGIASIYTLYRTRLLSGVAALITKCIFLIAFCFIFVYPFFAFPAYYGNLSKPPQLDGSQWLAQQYPQDKEIIDYINTHLTGQPTILEAQGDSYTDYERISAYTGLPTVGGWWVHEWLWRGSSDIIGKRIPDIVSLYESPSIPLTQQLLDKYGVDYVIISSLERSKYPKLDAGKFEIIGKKIFESRNRLGALYQVIR